MKRYVVTFVGFQRGHDRDGDHQHGQHHPVHQDAPAVRAAQERPDQARRDRRRAQRVQRGSAGAVPAARRPRAVSRGPTAGMIREFTVNVVVYGDFDCLLCYLASQRADHLAGTGAAGIEWRAVERGAASARWEQEVAQAEALALPGERLPTAPPPALSSTAAAVAAYAEAITDGIQDELRHRLFDAIWVLRQNLSSAYDVRQVVTAITSPAPPIYFHLASPDLPFRCCTTPTRSASCAVRRDGHPRRRAADHHRIPAVPGLAGAVAFAFTAGHPGGNRAGRHGSASARTGCGAWPRSWPRQAPCPGGNGWCSRGLPWGERWVRRPRAGRPVSCRGAGSGSERAALGQCPRAAPARPGESRPDSSPDRDPDRRRDQSHGHQHRCHRDSYRDAGRLPPANASFRYCAHPTVSAR